jgi:5'-nucleotidase (lipoprotein e(P4) family)
MRIAPLLVVLTLGCRSASEPALTPPGAPPAAVAQAASPAPSPGATPAMPDSLHWFRNAAEYQAIALQTYRLAAEVLDRRVEGKAAGSWAVILDADETLLDNSQYLKERLAVGEKFTSRTWREWTSRKTAPNVPGGADFLLHIHERGGRIAIVTNRASVECEDTEANLKSNGLVYDLILCNPDLTDSSKEARFAQVAHGTTPAGLPPLEVVMWVGDNIRDFPGMTQDARSDPSRLADFGERFIVLPNPTYGSWERTPRQ